MLQRRDSARSVKQIYDRTRRVLALSDRRQVSTARIADELAEARFKPKATGS